MCSDGADESNPKDGVITQEEESSPQLNGRKLSWTKLRRADSLDIESASLGGRLHHAAASTVRHFTLHSFNLIFPFSIINILTAWYVHVV